MAITALEIEAIFRIEDFATPAFKKIADEARALSVELKKIAADTSAVMGSSFNTMAAGIGKQIADVDLLRDAWLRVGAAAKAAATAAAAPAAPVAAVVRTAAAAAAPTLPLPALPAVPGGGGRGGGGIGASLYPSVPIPGAGHVHLHGNQAALAGAALAGYGVSEAFKMGDVVSRGLANVFPEGSVQDRQAKQKELEAIILREAEITKLPLGVVSKMAMDEIRTNANQPWDARMRIMPMVIENAAREAYIKGTHPEATTAALIGQLHQTGAFSPEEIEKNLPMLAYFASKDPTSVINIAKSAAYHSPLSRTMMGIPIEQDLAAQTVLDRTGVGGKSGTWLREMVVRAAPPLSTDTSKKAQKRRAELKELGLVDDAGKSTWMTDGHFDEQKLLHILSDRIGKMPLEDRVGKLGLFGERGKGAVALMTDPAMLKQYDEVLTGARNLQSTTEFWKEQNQANPMQAMKGAWVELQTVLLALGQTILPAVVAGLRAFNNTLEDLRKHLPSGAGPIVGGATVGGTVAGYMAGGPVGAVVGGVATTQAAKEALDNRVRGGGFLGAMENLFKFMRWMAPGKAKADELGQVPGPSTFGERFGNWGRTFGTSPGGRGPGAIGPVLPGLFGPRAPASFNNGFGGFGSGAASPSSFVPPPGPLGMGGGQHQKAITVSTNLNIDGRTLASMVSEHIVGMGDVSGGVYGPGNSQYSAS